MTAFWIDEDYDRDRASQGGSRYGNYVRRHLDEFDDDWEGPAAAAVGFAAAAWRIATSPVMSPGYVRSHGRVLASRVERNPWDGGLRGVVELAVPWPAQLAQDEQAWRGDSRWWQGWEKDHGRFFEPGEEQAAGAPYMLTTSRLMFPLTVEGLPPAPAGAGGDVARGAAAAVAVLVGKLNTVVDPIIERLEK
ncbi:hypothetical protein GCM10017673_38910 [Streptosporangium violaceochromogenes]|nr:hypothetical protein GCM10017673_38910 [Streptosporangium violaceochromogenes]